MTSPTVTDPEVRRWHLRAAVALLPLSVVDIATTLVALSLGASEANPLAAWLIDLRAMPLVKVMLPTVIFLSAWRGTTHTVRLVAASWLVVGVYACVALVNIMAIARLA